MPKDIKISQLKAVVPDREGAAVVVKAEALIDGAISFEMGARRSQVPGAQA